MAETLRRTCFTHKLARFGKPCKRTTGVASVGPWSSTTKLRPFAFKRFRRPVLAPTVTAQHVTRGFARRRPGMHGHATHNAVFRITGTARTRIIVICSSFGAGLQAYNRLNWGLRSCSCSTLPRRKTVEPVQILERKKASETSARALLLRPCFE